MVHTDTNYATTGYDKVLDAAYLVYKRQGTSEEFREANNRLVSTISKFPASRLFVDTKDMGIISPEDQKWVGNTIVPLLAKQAPGGYLYIAILVSEKIFTKLAVNAIEEISNGKGICLNKHFFSASEAKHWLTQQSLRLV